MEIRHGGIGIRDACIDPRRSAVRAAMSKPIAVLLVAGAAGLAGCAPLGVTAFGVGASRSEAPLIPRLMYRLLLSDIFADKLAAEDYLRGTRIEWTFVYPVLLTDGPRTGRYRAGEHLALRGLPKISRADVADFILRELRDAAYVRKTAVLSY